MNAWQSAALLTIILEKIIHLFHLADFEKENMTTLTRQDLNFGQGKTTEPTNGLTWSNILPLKLAVSSHHAVDSSFPVVADILCEFLEVAIHLILYVREVYPSGIFQKRKKYNVPVQVCGFTICSQFLMNSYPFISLNTGLLVLVC